MIPRARHGLLAGALVMAGSWSAAALEYPEPRTTAELAKQANRIVVATCLKSESRYKDEKSWTIVTESQFKAEELVKGSLPSPFTLSTFGGTVGEVQIDGVYDVRCTPGEEVILFLGPDDTDGHPFLFLDTWMYQTLRDEDSELWVVATPITGMKLFKAGTRQLLFPEPAIMSTSAGRITLQNLNAPVSVQDFVWSIRQLLQNAVPEQSHSSLDTRHSTLP